ncbi:MAG: TRAP transporter large permease subunit [Lachnospiraceae bacterium]|nr:TRAP transporter large permease subunit [Lachnospiraceae bacterium]
MGMSFLYLGVMLVVILAWFLLLKRPIYEAIFISFVAVMTIGGKWGNILNYIKTGFTTSLLYSMVVFVAMSMVLTKTKIIDGAVEIILALLGRFRGGAGYVAVAASSFMGALSGSGPGNVMATGSITIPAMKKSGFPSELAANIESTSSCLGNMIPPSNTIVAALGVLAGLYPEREITTGQFWIVCWGCSIWFIVMRFILVYVFCRIHKVKPVPKEDIPSLKKVFKEGWRGLLLPIIIFVPFLLDYLYKSTLFTDRLGKDGAKFMSSSLLYFIAGLATIYAMTVVKDKKQVKLTSMAKMFGDNIKSIVPTIAVCLVGYMFGALFNDLEMSEGIKSGIETLNLGKAGLCIIIPLLTCVMGIAIVGSSMVVVFGGIFVSLFAAVGVDPLLVGAMLPCICAVMSNMVPPIAPAFLAGISLAEADFSKAVKNDIWWIVGQYVMEIVILLGWLPIIGL